LKSLLKLIILNPGLVPKKMASYWVAYNCWGGTPHQSVANITGWWLTYPSEKYESQLGLLFPIIYGKIKAMFQTTNQINVGCWLVWWSSFVSFFLKKIRPREFEGWVLFHFFVFFSFFFIGLFFKKIVVKFSSFFLLFFYNYFCFRFLLSKFFSWAIFILNK
jgi:hypothetical protein